jgi:ATP-binding cassette, subfamily C, bacteriocin exporter
MQRDLSDCGAACLSSIARHYRRPQPVARIRQLAFTDQRGTTVLGLVEAATSLGFTAKGVKGPIESLARIPLPAVAHVIDRERKTRHYVVIYRVTRSRVIIMDPADGRVHRQTRAEFAAQWTGVLMILMPTSDARLHGDTGSVPARFWRLLRPHRGVLAQALLGAAISTLLGLAPSVYVQKVVDYVLVDGNRNLLNLMSVAMLGLLAAQMLVGAMKSVFTLRTGQQIDAELILGYYTHLLRLPQRFFDTMRVGEITSRINDAVKIRAFINDVALELIVDFFVVLFSFGLLTCYSPRLALLAAASIPLYAALAVAANRYHRRASRSLMERASDLQAQLVESLGAVQTIKRFGLEEFSNLRTEGRFVRLLRGVYGMGVAGITVNTGSQVVARVSTIALLWMGSSLAIDRQMTPGELMSCYAVLGYMLGPIAALVGATRTVQDALIAAERLFEIMDLELDVSSGRIQLSAATAGDIRLERVAFRYGARGALFRDLSLVIPAGRLTAIVGESGSGKSTIASILQRVYPIDAGRVTIGGVDVSYVSVESLRRWVGVVPQRIDLFSGNVIENIAVGEFEPDLRRVMDACARVGITELIERLPQGLESQLGENGTLLSGGERQRLAIARALYRDPRVLILDEATSALDSASERYVRRAVRALRDEGRTVIVIAHRLASVMDADRIVVLRQGAVVEEATHAELLGREGEYARLWTEQVRATA